MNKLKNRAFTFVEILVSIGVLALTLTALIAFFAQSLELNAISQDKTLAASHAQYVLEDIRSSSGVINTQIDAGVWDIDTNDEFAVLGLQRMDNEVIDVAHDASTPPELTVTITWQLKNGRQEQITFYTIDSGV
jgi:type II secretory pathway pseudopilin PulG